MSLLPKIKYGDIEETRMVDESHTITTVSKYNDAKLKATKIIIREQHIIPCDKTGEIEVVLTALYSDSAKLQPKFYNLQTKSNGSIHLVTEYTLLS